MRTRGAIAPQPDCKMAPKDVAWDASAELAKASGAAQLRMMHAWVDPEGDPDVKSSYKLPHHTAGGECVIRGVEAAAGRLDQTDIPDGDVAGVKRHLEEHYDQFDMDAPWKDDDNDGDEQKAAPGYERRFINVTDLRLQQRHRGAQPTIVGHAAVFNSLSEDLGFFRERIRPGAFARTLREGPAVYALWNHNPDFVIASTVDQSLRLSEDDTGLLAEMDPMDTQTIRDLVVKPIRDGKVNKMSFGFQTVTDEIHSEDGVTVRELLDVDLFDVSPVVFPAYPATDVSARMRAVVGRLERGLPITSEDDELVQNIIRILSELTRGRRAQGGARPTPTPPEPTATAVLEGLRRRGQILEWMTR